MQPEKSSADDVIEIEPKYPTIPPPPSTYPQLYQQSAFTTKTKFQANGYSRISTSNPSQFRLGDHTRCPRQVSRNRNIRSRWGSGGLYSSVSSFPSHHPMAFDSVNADFRDNLTQRPVLPMSPDTSSSTISLSRRAFPQFTLSRSTTLSVTTANSPTPPSNLLIYPPIL